MSREVMTRVSIRHCEDIDKDMIMFLFVIFFVVSYISMKYVAFIYTKFCYMTDESVMAVKKHELVGDSRAQLDLATLALYIQTYNNQVSSYLPPPDDLIRQCQEIVKCLARTPVSGVSADAVWSQLQAVEEFLLRVMSLADRELRQEILTTVLKKMYSFISDPQSDACPATSVTLIVFEGSDSEVMASMARWLIHESGNGPAGAGQRAALSCLYRWTCTWQGTPALGDWTLVFVKALEEDNNFDILMEVSLDNLESLFLTLDSLSPRQNIADVVFHVMASMRDSLEAFDRISPHVGRVLVNLAADSGQWSRQLLQNAVDVLTSMIDRLASFHPRLFKEKYAPVIRCLERHMASRGCRYLSIPSWNARCARLPAPAPSPQASPSATLALYSGLPYRMPRRVGLHNLGNTCYMNSIMQALLVTRHFSRQAVLKMHSMPYWSKLAILFSKMMYSISNKMSPQELTHLVKPPFFTLDNQHDSSEFLGYLLELLMNHEGMPDSAHDYSRPPPDTVRLRTILPTTIADPESSHTDTPSNRRSLSPRPGSSSASTSGKRPSADHDPHGHGHGHGHAHGPPPPKRTRARPAPPEPAQLVAQALRQSSFVDSLFGGVLLTRVECSECHFSSLSRDVFRDLQLAFPEKPEPGRQHSVQSLLEFYCSKERLSGENKYRCPDCCALKDAERSVLIEAPPKYLILVLKNFRFEPKLQVQTKLMHTMIYNQTVTLPTVRSQAEHSTYQLYATVIHSGTTLDSGHYYTLAKDNDQWHLYNDDVVSASKEADINTLTNCCTPYILFYRRDDVDEGSVPALQEIPVELQDLVMVHNKHFVDSVRKIRLQQRP